MGTYYFQEEREEWFIDPVDGIPTASKHIDSDIDQTWDWTDLLGSETISSVAWDTDGPTLTNKANTNTTTTATVDGIGLIKMTVTTSGSQTIVKRAKFIGEQPGDTVDDYRFKYRP